MCDDKQRELDGECVENQREEINKLPLKKTESRKTTIIVSIILLIIGAVVSIIEQLLDNYNEGSNFDSYNLAYMVGSIIGTGIVVAIIIFIGYRIKSENAKANFMIIVSIIFLLAQISSFGQTTYEISKEHIQKLKTQEALSEMMQNDFMNANIKNRIFTEEAYGKNATKLTAFERLLNKIIVEKTKYNEVHNFLVTDTYIKRTLLSSKDSISNSISELEKHKSTINNYKNTYFGNSEELRNLISDIDFSYAYKKTFLEGFDSIIIDNKIMFEEYFDIEMKYCDFYIDILEFLRDSCGKFEVDESDTCLFYEQKDTDIFNEKIDIINEILLKQEDKAKDIENIQEIYRNRIMK